MDTQLVPTTNNPAEPLAEIPIVGGARACSELRAKLKRLPQVNPMLPSGAATEPTSSGSVTLDSTNSRPSTRPTGDATARPTSPVSGTFSTWSDRLKTARIMIVDDEPANVMVVRTYLEEEGYENFLTVTDSREAMTILASQKPDVLLLDINMPFVSGLDILRSLHAQSAIYRFPVIVLTGTTDPDVKRQALDLGANDFLTKPLDEHDLVPRVRNALIVKSHMDDMVQQTEQLEQLVQQRTAELLQSRQQLILSLARAAEHRDNDTANHVLRVGKYAAIIAKQLGWDPSRVEMLEQAAQLHDVGKIGIPDAILFKPGKLDPQEYELMQKHCALGKGIIEPMSEKDFLRFKTHAQLGENILNVRNSPMLLMAAIIAQTHHERWDGSGYPIGLAGEDIPLEGRITSVADVFDALASPRPYKPAFPREKCFQILHEGRGTQFDPNVLDAFFARSAEIVQVQLDFMDQ